MVKKIAKALTKIPVVRAPILLFHRCVIVAGYFLPATKQAVVWLFRSRENTNFTYDLTEANKGYLAAFISHITGKPYAEIRGYVAELEHDTWLIAHVQQMIQTSDQKHLADHEIWFSKRLGWYAFVRAMKPAVTIETGLDKGLGSCIIARALQRNEKDGAPGIYYGTDINPKAGYLFTGDLAKYGKLLYGDSIESLRKITGKVDLFINDSDHSASYEQAEYEVILPKLSEHAVVLGDNAHATDELFRFSVKHGREFLFWQEDPRDHWYAGGGIGASFKPTR